MLIPGRCGILTAIFDTVCLSILLLTIIGINDFCFWAIFKIVFISFSSISIYFDKLYKEQTN